MCSSVVENIRSVFGKTLVFVELLYDLTTSPIEIIKISVRFSDIIQCGHHVDHVYLFDLQK